MGEKYISFNYKLSIKKIKNFFNAINNMKISSDQCPVKDYRNKFFFFQIQWIPTLWPSIE